jgi:cytochrome c-type biogenesis protein CcmE
VIYMNMADKRQRQPIVRVALIALSVIGLLGITQLESNISKIEIHLITQGRVQKKESRVGGVVSSKEKTNNEQKQQTNSLIPFEQQSQNSQDININYVEQQQLQQQEMNFSFFSYQEAILP